MPGTAVTGQVADGFSYEAWMKGLNAGRSSVTTGPMLLARIEGNEIRGTIDALVLQGLTSSTTYGVKVKARNQDGEETALSAEGQGTTTGAAPPAPVATSATNITPTSFSANWNASAGATGYRLDVATDSASRRLFLGSTTIGTWEPS